MANTGKLTQQDIEIIEEYFLNGFNKVRAYQKFRNNHSSGSSLRTASSQFWKRKAVVEYIEQRTNERIGNRTELINELLVDMKRRVFEEPVGEGYSYTNRQKDIELLMRISGIDKAPKFKEDIKSFGLVEDIVINIIGSMEEEERTIIELEREALEGEENE